MAFSKLSAARAALAFAVISVGAAVAQGASPETKPTVREKPIVLTKPSTPIFGYKLVGTVRPRFGRATVSGLQNLGGLRPLKNSHRHRPLPLPPNSNNWSELPPTKNGPG